MFSQRIFRRKYFWVSFFCPGRGLQKLRRKSGGSKNDRSNSSFLKEFEKQKDANTFRDVAKTFSMGVGVLKIPTEMAYLSL